MTLVHVGFALRLARTRQDLEDIRRKGGLSTNRIALLAEFRRGDPTPRRMPQYSTWGKLDDGVDIFGIGTSLKLLDLPDDATDEDVEALLKLPNKVPENSKPERQSADALAIKLGRLPPVALSCLGQLVDYILELPGPSEQTG